MNQPSPANAFTPVRAIEIDFDFLFPTQPSALESEMLTKIGSPNVSQPHQPSKDSSSTKASVEGEPSSNHSIPKSTLQSSKPSSPWFQVEPHSTGSSPSSSFTSTPFVEFKHATVDGEPPISGSSGLFQDDLFEGTFTSNYPPRPREQYEVVCTPQILKEARLSRWTKDHPVEQIISDLGSGVVTRSTTKKECLYASFLSIIEPKGIKECHNQKEYQLLVQDGSIGTKVMKMESSSKTNPDWLSKATRNKKA
uniref:Uncharacterized protein n=1 Tax=Lactuca sativa TaxID=4236 RepID=A0A9R1W149_LACSA|nr:hypothetical protein LSAT_V11C300101700 [Lactuca sativa]